MIDLTRSLFLRGVGLVYAIAFASLAVQVVGLLGGDGLEPAAWFLEAVRSAVGAGAPWRVPTLFWLDASDSALRLATVAGTLCGVLAFLGLVPLPALALCWLLYLSIVNVGGDFLLYQWDALLLETGFLALFWAPLGLRLHPRPARPPSRIVLWLLRWLVFRLMFFSGWVKLTSGDTTWWKLSALSYHYETQPLPTWLGWYAGQLPAWADAVACALVFAVELVAPWLVFLGRRARAVAAAAFVGLQLVIAATGNYGFFNLLTVVLCIPLLDDRQLRSLLPAAMARRLGLGARLGEEGSGDAAPARGARHLPLLARLATARDVAVAALILLLTVPVAIGQVFGRMPRLPSPVTIAHDLSQRLHLVGRYGLFAVMTTTRPEIVVEGSDDGDDWRPYVFRWKPGPLDRAPAFVEPHMPRLDWQMWFDALHVERAMDGLRSGRELVTPRLVERLLEASPPVLALLDGDPFAGAPPRFVRWQLYHYRFTDPAERERTGAWWTRRLLYDSRIFAREELR